MSGNSRTPCSVISSARPTALSIQDPVGRADVISGQMAAAEAVTALVRSAE